MFDVLQFLPLFSSLPSFKSKREPRPKTGGARVRTSRLERPLNPRTPLMEHEPHPWQRHDARKSRATCRAEVNVGGSLLHRMGYRFRLNVKIPIELGKQEGRKICVPRPTNNQRSAHLSFFVEDCDLKMTGETSSEIPGTRFFKSVTASA